MLQCFAFLHLKVSYPIRRHKVRLMNLFCGKLRHACKQNKLKNYHEYNHAFHYAKIDMIEEEWDEKRHVHDICILVAALEL